MPTREPLQTLLDRLPDNTTGEISEKDQRDNVTQLYKAFDAEEVDFDPTGLNFVLGDTVAQAIEDLDDTIEGRVAKTQAIISSDPQVILIPEADLSANVNLTIKNNIPNGLVKLNDLGLVPASLLPTTNLNYIGPYDASSNTLPPDANEFDYYIISVGGTLNLIVEDNGTPTPTAVSLNDQIIYSGVSGEWYYAEQSSLAVIAASVNYDSTFSGIPATNVQDAIDQLDNAVDFLNTEIGDRPKTNEVALTSSSVIVLSNLWAGTKADFDLIAIKDPNTIYHVTE